MKQWLLHTTFLLCWTFSALAQAPVITHIEPPAAIPGSTVTIYGKYFDPTPANNTVTFAGVASMVISGTASRLVVTVPVATTGPGDVIVSSSSLNSLAFNFTVLTVLSPGVFGNQNTLTTTADRPYSVYAADLDGDGDLDVISASELDDKIAWYENGGAGDFSLPASSSISTIADGAQSVYAADLDGDGDMDVLSASSLDDKIAWYENTDGLGGFGVEQTITTIADGATSVYAADLDGDGDMDVLSASWYDDKIAWYKNDGAGGFSLPASSTITNTADGAQSVYAADLDGDGDMDVLSASSSDNTIAWYKNDGIGGFTAQPAIIGTANGASSVYAADLDGDGDMDVLSASWDNKITWYMNDGAGGFTLPPSSTITNTAKAASSVYAADLDGDGDIDVLSASSFDDKIAWYMNDGAGGFTPQPAITTTADWATSVYAADLDGDGDMDVLSTSIADNKIAWYPNRIANITRIEPISAVSGNTIKIYGNNIDLNVAIVTFNGTASTIDVANSTSSVLKVTVPDITPGLIDVVITSPIGNSAPQALANFTILSSTPPDTAIAQAAITTTADWARSVYAADLDGDGDLDVLSASSLDDKIAWYENDGAGGFNLPASSTITTTADWANSVYAADLDGDGDLDVLSASYNDHKIAWYKNDGAGEFTLPPSSTITNTAVRATSVYAADLDGDGDLDVLSASEFDDKIAWYKNDGAGGFTLPASSTITTIADGAISVHAADLDGDGDMDVLSASYNDNKIAWYKNDGTGGFTVQPAITTTADWATSVYAADLDGDGDMDVLSASYNDNKIAWYENDGAGGFTLPASFTITTTAYGARSVYAADLDGDGDLDVVSASENDDKIAWYKRSFTGNEIVTFTIAEETVNKVIENINLTVDIEVVNGTDLTSITPVAGLSPGASVVISSSDYSSQVTYTVTSEVGVSQDWLVNVIPVTDAPVLSLTTAEQTTAGFSWNQPAYAQGYKLEASTDAAFSGFITGYPKNITNAATLSESLTGLTAGTQYYVRIRAYNQFNTESVNSATLNIISIPAEPVATAATSITSASFQANWNIVNGVDYYILEVSSDDFGSLTLRDSITGQLLADVTGLSPITEYKYRLRAGNNSGVSGFSNVIMITTPFTNSESPVIPFELFGGTDQSWNLFSIPYELNNNSVSSIFADYDPSRHEFDWRIVRYRNSSNDYVNFQTGQVSVGEAYWFNAKENIAVKVGAGQVNSQVPFTKALTQGWNLIGNPYPINISWAQVIIDNPTVTGVEGLQVFSGRAQSAGDIMAPFSGGFVWSDQATSVVIDPLSAGTGGRISSNNRKIESTDIDGPEWLLDISLETDETATRLGGFGMHPEASGLKDQYDAMAVPRFMVYTELFTEHDDYFYPWFATDVVPTATSHTWAFTLASNEAHGLTRFSWDQAALQGKEARLYLLDKSSGSLVDMTQQGSHVVDLESGEFKFAIYFTAEDQPFLPKDLILGTAYPNPANTLTTIPVVLPAGAGDKRINLSIYDINGKHVATLAEGSYAPGVHEFSWDINGDDQQSTSGMFIYRLLVSDGSIAPMQKKLIIR